VSGEWRRCVEVCQGLEGWWVGSGERVKGEGSLKQQGRQ